MAVACASCSTELEKDAVVCAHCGAAVPDAPAASIEATDSFPHSSGVPTFSTGSDLEGIGGWLILVAVGLAISPFVLLKGIFTDLRVLYGAQFQNGLAHYPGLASLILFEATSNSIFLLGLVALNFLFYRKMKSFPGWMIAYLAINCTVLIIDHLLALRYTPQSAMNGVLRSILVSLVWIPYYLRSERVKTTFVN